MDAISIRPARPEDAAAIARLDVETWRAAYAGILTTPYLVGLSAERRERGWVYALRRTPQDVQVAVDADHTILGFGSCGRCRDEPSYSGEVFTLYVAPDWQNQGIGRRLLTALFERLVEAGHESAVIWVLSDNPARFFYRHLGGSEMRRKTIQFAGASVAASGFGWRDLRLFLSKAALGHS